MRLTMGAAAAALIVCLAPAAPAPAQFYFKSRDLSGAPVTGDEPGILQPLPGATPAERRAGLTWTMRAALNVAALQCGFQPTLLSVNSYNALLVDHKAELAASWDIMNAYFVRTHGKTKTAGQAALDHFQTLTYSSFSTIQAQITFCETAAAIGRDAQFTPRGQLGVLAEQRMRELRNSLTPYGEQQGFTQAISSDAARLPRFDAVCWSKKAEWLPKKCGAQNWPPAGAGVAALARSPQP